MPVSSPFNSTLSMKFFVSVQGASCARCIQELTFNEIIWDERQMFLDLAVLLRTYSLFYLLKFIWILKMCITNIQFNSVSLLRRAGKWRTIDCMIEIQVRTAHRLNGYDYHEPPSICLSDLTEKLKCVPNHRNLLAQGSLSCCLWAVRYAHTFL